jgi:mono/diheme cytochrome c family protein
MPSKSLLALLAATAALAATQVACSRDDTHAAQVARGRYLVTAMGCNDCHTPLVMGPNGPEPDMSRMLSGHPQDMQLPLAPVLPPGPWNTAVAATLTAWSGPWGVSFTHNLTPDRETGLGAWSLADFTDAMRTGRHQGRGRQILPPMPWQSVAALTDDDIAAVFAYLQSIPAISNRVPEPIAPLAPTDAH